MIRRTEWWSSSYHVLCSLASSPLLYRLTCTFSILRQWQSHFLPDLASPLPGSRNERGYYRFFSEHGVNSNLIFVLYIGKVHTVSFFRCVFRHFFGVYMACSTSLFTSWWLVFMFPFSTSMSFFSEGFMRRSVFVSFCLRENVGHASKNIRRAAVTPVNCTLYQSCTENETKANKSGRSRK